MDKPPMTCDYIIVGQGLAGTLLGYFLQKAGKTVLFVDGHHHHAATHVAAGILNPVTGRRYVKSWMVDELFPFAKALYAELEEELGVRIFYGAPIVRCLFNAGEESHWMMRSVLPEYAPYICEPADWGTFAGAIAHPHSYFELGQGGRADISTLVTSLRKKWVRENTLLSERFDYSALEILEGGGVLYQKKYAADTVICCEGFQVRENPYFGYLEHSPTKGEALLVRIPNASFSKLLKHRLFVVPFGGDMYWVGATNNRKRVDCEPQETTRGYLENRLSAFLKLPFEVVEHRAAVRPTVQDRRPFLGRHPKYHQLAIFNGLGAKGASLGPYWADKMARFLVEGRALEEAVDIRRMAPPEPR